MKNDLEQYNKQGTKWWDPKGPFYVLKSMNGPRFEFFDKCISSWKDAKVLDIGCGVDFPVNLYRKRVP